MVSEVDRSVDQAGRAGWCWSGAGLCHWSLLAFWSRAPLPATIPDSAFQVSLQNASRCAEQVLAVAGSGLDFDHAMFWQVRVLACPRS